MVPREVARIFRLYDIRGVCLGELTPEVASRVGLALAHYERGVYAVGMDARRSSPYLRHAVMAGLMAGGAGVVDVGLVPIGAIMYTALHKRLAAVYVTASHLPPEWNGFKLFKRGGDPMVGDEIARLRDLFFSDLRVAERPGDYARADVLSEYFDFLLSRARGSGLRVVVDCGNGVASLVAPRLLREAGHEVYTLNADVDPDFPARGSEPLPERLGDLCEEVVRRRAHFGVAFDGDGDRVVFVDERGRVLSAEQAAIVMLEGMGYGDVVANVDCSAIVEEAVRRRGFRVRWVPVGRTFVVREVVRSGAVLGVESSGHYVVWGNANMDDGLLATLYFAEAVARLGRVSDAVPPQPPTVRVKVEVPDEVKFRVVEMVKERVSREAADVITIDGVKVNLGDAWVLVRASNTEPAIRVTCEARDPEAARRLAEEYASLVRSLAADLRS